MKINNKNKRGISLIVLVITIIVIIILAAAVILTLTDNNPIDNAKKATFVNDIGTFQSELDVYKANKYATTLGEYESKNLDADETNLNYNDEKQGTDTMYNVITSLKGLSKYQNMFEIIDGELWYKSAKNSDWAIEAGVKVDDGIPKTEVSTIQSLPVKAGTNVDYAVEFSSNTGLTTINLTSKVIITDESGLAIATQPTVTAGTPTGTTADTTRTVTLNINTLGMPEGKYKVKILSGSVTNANSISNDKETLSSTSFEIDNTAPNMPSIGISVVGYTSDDLTVTITPTVINDKLEYSLDGTNYQEYTTPFTISNNFTISARETDKANNTSEKATLEVNLIDKVAPQNTTFNLTTAADKINGTLILIDNESGINISQSKYVITTQSTAYATNDVVWNTGKQITANPQTISETCTYSDYYVQVLSTDNVGNKRVNISSKITVANTGIIDPGYVATKGINGPVLKTGMTAKKWDGSTWVTVTDPINDTSWYDYTNKQWANAQTLDGSMWVWIPRYEYKIPTPNSSTAQTIAINFINGIGTTPTSGYTIHPGFTFGTDELTGIWIAKFEASGTITSISSKPNISSLRNITINVMFTACRNMETLYGTQYGWGTSGIGIDTHLIKNIEWGLVAYLSSSLYGKNTRVEGNSNVSYLTGGGAYSTNILQSTTGNIYGVYDMSGGAYEFTAAYISNGHSSLTTYASSLLNAELKYKDVYNVTTDSSAQNYSNAINKKGDAIHETSNSGIGSTAWYGGRSIMPELTYPLFLYGDFYGNATVSSAFSFLHPIRSILFNNSFISSSFSN